MRSCSKAYSALRYQTPTYWWGIKLLDEPYEGLAPVIVREIEKILQEIKSQGFTTIIVEQNAIAALNLSDRALILDMGEIVFDGTAKDVIENSELRQQYLAI